MSINSRNQLTTAKVRAQLAGIPQQPTTEAADQAQRDTFVSVLRDEDIADLNRVLRTAEDPQDAMAQYCELMQGLLNAEFAAKGSDQAAVVVGRAVLVIDCPAWCVGHEGATGRYANLADVHHIGEAAELPVPQSDGSTLEGLNVFLQQWPFSRDGNRQPFLGVEDDGTGEQASLNSVGGLAFVDQIRAYADQVERKVRQLAAHEQGYNQ
ncbi:DUF6907 domain-containing protein [Streptomyces sp. WAC05858]|uniref:DUF6907 domain-containing protein n=1 Tax=Streptomyces TaxID=1883 RepID=UPI000F768A41|nr:hypothetical protein [Streptomyces sp. WAC05858]RSS47564.1 hypothetical protein EF902_08915 [Streptomyces sp. WAC05858]